LTDQPSTPLRLFLAALSHETNSFSPLPTTVQSFELGVLYRPGDASTRPAAEQFPGYGDCLRQAANRGDEVLAGLCAWAQPGGPMSRSGYESLRDELLAQLHASPAPDAVFLMLHGAMMAEGYPDCEGDLLLRVRAIVGPTTPLGVLLDLHGNVTPAMIASGALIMACKEYPHIDYAERTAELLDILTAAARSPSMPRTLMHRVPMLGLWGTTEEPMRGFVQRLVRSEQQDGVLSVSAMHGFPWGDSPDTSASILVIHAGDDEAVASRAAALADTLANDMFSLRTSASAPRLPVDEALDQALSLRSDAGPVVVADAADNAGGGAAADSTFILRALLDRGVRNAAVAMMWDPQAAAVAASAGVGARLPMRIGGKVGPMSGAPVDGLAEVLAVRTDATQHGLDGKQKDALGLAVAIRIDGVDIVLNSIRQQTYSPDCLTELGIDVARKSLVVVKSSQHFRAAFDRVSVATVYCNTPGSLNSDLTGVPYCHLARPIWPLDADASPSDVRHTAT
jgi:microcystin degradation protein MlrC